MWIRLRAIRCASYIENELCAWIKSSTMYNDMVAVCKKNGLTPDSHRKFSLELHKYGWNTATSKKRDNTGILYRIYGAGEETFKDVTDITDMDVAYDDVFEQQAGYDPADIA